MDYFTATLAIIENYSPKIKSTRPVRCFDYQSNIFFLYIKVLFNHKYWIKGTENVSLTTIAVTTVLCSWYLNHAAMGDTLACLLGANHKSVLVAKTRNIHISKGCLKKNAKISFRTYTTLCLHCTALYCSILYCTVLYCTVLYCTVLYCTVLYCTVLYCTVLYCTVLYCTVLYCTVLYCTVLYCTVLYSICTLLYWTALYCTRLYCIVMNYTVLHCTVQHCTV